MIDWFYTHTLFEQCLLAICSLLAVVGFAAQVLGIVRYHALDRNLLPPPETVEARNARALSEWYAQARAQKRLR